MNSPSFTSSIFNVPDSSLYGLGLKSKRKELVALTMPLLHLWVDFYSEGRCLSLNGSQPVKIINFFLSQNHSQHIPVVLYCL